MKKFLLIIVVLVFWSTGCVKPTEVELRPDNSVDVETVEPGEIDIERPGVDSSGVLPAEHQRFAGLVLLNSIKIDRGDGLRAVAFSSVKFEHRGRPVVIGNRPRGFFGIPLGRVRLNGDTMTARPHSIGGFQAGVAYYKDLTGSYQPNQTYTWLATPNPDTLGAVAVSIRSTDDLSVQSPRGGARISRDEDLHLRWTGQGRLSIVISAFDPLSHDLRPLLRAQVRNNIGHAVVEKKLLRALPRSRFFVLTFVLANRNEAASVDRFSGRILVQAASVYNSVVEIP